MNKQQHFQNERSNPRKCETGSKSPIQLIIAGRGIFNRGSTIPISVIESTGLKETMRGKVLVYFLALFIPLLCLHETCTAEAGKNRDVPRYILNGLKAYQGQGYEAAVKAWLADSPWSNATLLVSRIAFFRNIEMLYGKYQGYEVISTLETRTSQTTYIRFIYEKKSGYGLFTSSLHNNAWVLLRIELHDVQRYAGTGK